MSTGDVVVAIQARTGSTRLPGKVLAEVAGRPMLRFQLDRLRTVTCGRLVVATSTDPGDDAVAELGAQAGVEVFRGPEGDVLGRYAAMIDALRPDTVVRLTGDCPLADPAIVDRVAEVHHREGADYTSNLFPRSYPKGLDVEVATADVLVEAAARAEVPSEREHVMPYLYRRPERHRMANVTSGRSLGELWWTVDTAADLESIRSMVDRLDDPEGAGWEQILEVVGDEAPDPDAVVLSVVGSSPTGSCPWVRTWSARRGHRDLGSAQVSVGDGKVQRRIDGADGSPMDEDDERAVSEALDRLLAHDEQIRLP